MQTSSGQIAPAGGSLARPGRNTRWDHPKTGGTAPGESHQPGQIVCLDVPSPVSDRLLLEAAAFGEQAAFKLLWHRHRNVVYAYAMTTLGDEDAAESVVADSFVVAWKKRVELAAEVQDFRAWIMRVAELHCRNVERKARRRSAGPDIAEYVSMVPDDDPEQTIELRDLVHNIRREVAQMSGTDAALFRQVIDEGAQLKDAAAAIGLSEGAAKMRMKRIRARLRRSMGEDA